MSDMENWIRAERAQAGDKEARRRLWERSGLSRSLVIVDQPSGQLAAFVQEISPLIPRPLWRTAYVGVRPDGLTAVMWDPETRRYRGTSRCKAFAATDPSPISGSDLFVVLKDGRAGYRGTLENWRPIIAHAIAAELYPNPALLELTYPITGREMSTPGGWRFE